MKTQSTLHLRFAAAIALASLATAIVPMPSARAIPNSVGGIGGAPFINPAGMRLEDFANRAAMWQANAKLKGDWEMWNDSSVEDSTIELLHLKNSAVVFGLRAEQVVLQSRDTLPLRFEIVFSVADGSTPDKTRDQLIANINAWSGKTMSADKPKIAAEHSKVEIGTAEDNAVRITLSAP